MNKSRIYLFFAFILIIFASVSEAAIIKEESPSRIQIQQDPDIQYVKTTKKKKWEISIGAGLGLAEIKTDSKASPLSWNYLQLTSCNEVSIFSLTAKKLVTAFASLGYLLSDHFIIRLSYETGFPSSLTSSQYQYKLNWTWLNTFQFSKDEIWLFNGNIKSSTLELSLAYKTDFKLINPYFQLGLSAFFGKAKVNSFFGKARTWEEGDDSQLFDYYQIPIQSNHSSSCFGIGTSVGVELKSGASSFLFLEIKYNYGKGYTFPFNIVPGNYSGQVWTDISYQFEQNTPGIGPISVPSLTLKLSDLGVRLGLRKRF